MNPVTLAVVRGSLEQIADEMDLHLIHAAISPIISETNDCAHGIFHPATGETIAQGRYGLPVFLAYMQFAVQNLIGIAAAEGGFRPGDVWIMNEPYIGGSHLQDVQLVAPYFVDGQLFALLASTGHWMDIGGNVPGGWAPRAQEIHQEGIIIPPVKLVENGRLNVALVRMFTANVRLPEQIAGDLAAMRNVFGVGERGLDALVAKHGGDVMTACLDEMIARSERQMRSYLAEIPDGLYRFEDFFDNDGITDAPVRLVVAVTVAGEAMHVDFTGTDAATAGPLNMSRNTTLSSCYVALKHIFPEVPVNGGTFRPIRFTVPEGTLLSAEYPTAVGGYLEVVGRVIDVMFGALAQAIPGRVPAAFFGTTGVVTVSGTHPRTGSYYVGVFPYPGGYGASQDGDGLVHATSPQSMANFMSLELSEHRFPIRFEQFALREGSGGAGAHRGGCGTQYGITATADCLVSVLGDRVDHAPFGVSGGGPAAASSVVFHTGGRSWTPELRSKQEKETLHAGDSIRLASPGGGGFGNPAARPLEAVEHDLNLGYVGAEAAERVYGVVIATRERIGGLTRYRLDEAASLARRREWARRGAGSGGEDIIADDRRAVGDSR